MDLCPDSSLPRNLPDGTGVIVLRDRNGLITQEAVRHIQPYPHGIWAVTNSWDGGFTVAYSAPQGTLYYLMHECFDLAAVSRHCRNHLLRPNPRPMVVNQIGTSSTTSTVATEQAENGAMQLPLRPHPPTFSPMGDSIEPTEADQVSGNLESKLASGSLDNPQAHSNASTDAMTDMSGFQDDLMATPGTIQSVSNQDLNVGDLDWALNNEFLQTGHSSNELGNNSIDNASQLAQAQEHLLNIAWEQNWTHVPDSDHNTERQDWERLIPKY